MTVSKIYKLSVYHRPFSSSIGYRKESFKRVPMVLECFHNTFNGAKEHATIKLDELEGLGSWVSRPEMVKLKGRDVFYVKTHPSGIIWTFVHCCPGKHDVEKPGLLSNAYQIMANIEEIDMLD